VTESRAPYRRYAPSPSELPFLEAAAGKRQKRCLELVQSVEAVLHAYRDAPDMPLDLIDRCERALVQTHTHNLLRLPEFPDLSVEGER
jgi:hypothetical protein